MGDTPADTSLYLFAEIITNVRKMLNNKFAAQQLKKGVNPDIILKTQQAICIAATITCLMAGVICPEMVRQLATCAQDYLEHNPVVGPMSIDNDEHGDITACRNMMQPLATSYMGLTPDQFMRLSSIVSSLYAEYHVVPSFAIHMDR